MTYIAKIESEVASIPCIIGVIEYTAADSGADSSDDYYGYSEWRVCDQSGRLAPWLERKLTSSDVRRIDCEIAEQL